MEARVEAPASSGDTVPPTCPTAPPAIEINCFTKLVVGRPVPLLCAIFAISCGLSYAATLTGLTLGHSWSDFQEPIVRRQHSAWRLRTKARQLPTPFSDGVEDGDSVETGSDPWFDQFCATHDEQTLGDGWNHDFIIKSKSGNILTAANIATVRSAIDKVSSLPGYSNVCLANEHGTCLPPVSLLPVQPSSSASPNDTCKCDNFCYRDEVPHPNYNAMASSTSGLTQMCNITRRGAIAKGNACKKWASYLRDTIFPVAWDCGTLSAESTRIHFRYAMPLNRSVCQAAIAKSKPGSKAGDEGYVDNETVFWQTFDRDVWPIVWQSLPNAMPGIKTSLEADNDDIEVFFYGELDILGFLWSDMALAGLSLVVVAVVLILQTGSVCITLAGLFEIFISIPLAMFVWSVVFGVPAVSNIIFVGVFVIVGIGADDIFVFVDAFRQSKHEPAHISGSLETRFQWAYKRSATAMLATSATTCSAFAVAALLPMWDMVNLAVFNASMVAMDYVLVITFLPCAVIIAERHLHPMWKRCKKKSGRFEQRWDKFFSPRNGEKRCLEKFYGGPFADLIIRSRRVLAATCVVLFIVSVSVSVTLIELDGEELRFFKKGHMENLAKTERELYSSPNNEHLTVKVFVGPTSVNAWELGDAREYLTPLKNDRGDNKVEHAWGGGVVHTDSSFDLSKSQEDFVTLCDTILVRMRARATKWVSSDETHVHCFMRDFKHWAIWKGHGFPVPENQLLALLMAWRKDPGGWWNATQMAINEFGLQDWWYPERTNFAVDSATKPTKILGAWMALNVTIREGTMPDVEKHTPMQVAFRGALSEALADIDSAHITSANTFEVFPFYHFIWMSNALFRFAMSAIAIAITLATGIILLMTANWLLSLIAAFTLATILCTALSLMILIGWKIGLNQACCLIVASGMAVDYVVHMIHSYNHQKGTRVERVRGAFEEMGISVTSGAITSSSSSLALVLCQFEVFYILGQFIILMIVTSFVITLFLMMAILSVIGPNEGEANVPFLIDWVKPKGFHSSVVAPSDSTTSAKNYEVDRFAS
jgi:hypothetical protein